MNLSVERARIKSGTIGYFDARSGNSQTPANSTLNQPIENSVVRPVAVTHSAAYRGVPTLFSATLHNAKSFLHGKPAMRW